MKTIIFSTDDIRRIVQHVGLDPLMDELIDRLMEAFRAFDATKTISPARAGFHYEQPNLGLIEWMPVMQLGGTAVVKIVGYHPTNPALKNLPTILSTVSAYDTATGHLIGLADATFLTALRTGAASAVASKLMARPQSQVVGLIGCGAQAVTQLHALSRVFNVKKVFCYDPDLKVSSTFFERASFLGLTLVEVTPSSLNQLVASADIICTTTSVNIGQGPVFADTGTKPWLHINAVGSDFPGKIEIPLSFLKKSFVCPDFVEQAVQEGECQQLGPEDIGPSLVELSQNQEKYLYVRQERSVFDSTGWALEDQVAMELLVDYATELGLGTYMQLESMSNDPRDPYQFIRDTNFTFPINNRISKVDVPQG